MATGWFGNNWGASNWTASNWFVEASVPVPPDVPASSGGGGGGGGGSRRYPHHVEDPDPLRIDVPVWVFPSTLSVSLRSRPVSVVTTHAVNAKAFTKTLSFSPLAQSVRVQGHAKVKTQPLALRAKKHSLSASASACVHATSMYVDKHEWLREQEENALLGIDDECLDLELV